MRPFFYRFKDNVLAVDSGDIIRDADGRKIIIWIVHCQAFIAIYGGNSP